MNFPHRKQLFTALLISCSIIQTSVAQSKIDGYFISPKNGIFNSGQHNGGYIRGIEGGITSKSRSLSIDYYHGTDYMPKTKSLFILNQTDVMVGKSTGEKFFRLEGQIGLGLLWGEKKTTVSQTDYIDPFNYFIIPAKVGITFYPTTFLGLGMEVQENFNRIKPGTFVILSVEIGNLRPPIDMAKYKKEPFIGWCISGAAGINFGQKSNGGIQETLRLKHYRSGFVYSASYTYLEDIGFMTLPQTHFHQFDICFGKYMDIRPFRFEYAAGLGTINGVMKGEYLGNNGKFLSTSFYEKLEYTSFTVPMNLGLKIIAGKYVSFGIEFQGNLNAMNSYIAPTFCIDVGKVQ